MDITKENFITLDNSDNKSETLFELSRTLSKDYYKELHTAFMNREYEYSTGLVEGFAIPHAKVSFTESIMIYFVNLNEEVLWKTLDDSMVRNLIVMVIPEKSMEQLKMLSIISRLMMDEEFRTIIKNQDEQLANEFIGRKL